MIDAAYYGYDNDGEAPDSLTGALSRADGESMQLHVAPHQFPQ